MALGAAADLTCPASSTTAISCYCSSGRPSCGVGPAAASPVSQPQGTDTICATISGVCSSSTQSLFQAQLGFSCTLGSSFTWLTSFRSVLTLSHQVLCELSVERSPHRSKRLLYSRAAYSCAQGARTDPDFECTFPTASLQRQRVPGCAVPESGQPDDHQVLHHLKLQRSAIGAGNPAVSSVTAVPAVSSAAVAASADAAACLVGCRRAGAGKICRPSRGCDNPRSRHVLRSRLSSSLGVGDELPPRRRHGQRAPPPLLAASEVPSRCRTDMKDVA